MIQSELGWNIWRILTYWLDDYNEYIGTLILCNQKTGSNVIFWIALSRAQKIFSRLS